MLNEGATKVKAWPLRIDWAIESSGHLKAHGASIGKIGPHAARAPQGAKEVTAKGNAAIAFIQLLHRSGDVKSPDGLIVSPVWGSAEFNSNPSPIAHAMGDDHSPDTRAGARRFGKSQSPQNRGPGQSADAER